MEKIRRDDPDWGHVLEPPGGTAPARDRGNADYQVDFIDERVVRLWKWETFYRGMALFVATVIVGVPLLLAFLPNVLWPQLLRASDAAVGISENGTRIYLLISWGFVIGILASWVMLLTTPKPNPTYICRSTRKVYGSSGLTGLGRWVEMEFDRITAVSVIERRYHQAGRTTTYSLWLCEVDPKTDRIVKRIVAMQPSRAHEVPRQSWDFICSYMNLPPEQVPPVLPRRRGTRWADRVYSANQRLFGMLLDPQSFQIEGPISQGFAVFLGGVMYPWEVTGWLLDRFLRERRALAGLRQVLEQPARQPNPYRIQGGDAAEEAKVQAVLKADGWVHASAIVLAVVLYASLFLLFSQVGRT